MLESAKSLSERNTGFWDEEAVISDIVRDNKKARTTTDSIFLMVPVQERYRSG